ncbi:MAG: hypothetical protein WDO24_24090 [Pseudomonadota bacterium]
MQRCSIACIWGDTITEAVNALLGEPKSAVSVSVALFATDAALGSGLKSVTVLPVTLLIVVLNTDPLSRLICTGSPAASEPDRRP